jgi:hypothetical protein
MWEERVLLHLSRSQLRSKAVGPRTVWYSHGRAERRKSTEVLCQKRRGKSGEEANTCNPRERWGKRGIVSRLAQAKKLSRPHLIQKIPKTKRAREVVQVAECLPRGVVMHERGTLLTLNSSGRVPASQV